jgi:CRP/FNR family transcriptional regulator, anaerobic regulatory protein
LLLLKHILSIIPVSKELENSIKQAAKRKTIAKGEIIINAGERCNHIYFIEKGLLRGFYFNEDKEITNWFASDGEFATSFYSFIGKQASTETIEALEDCELLQLSYDDLQGLYENFPATERLGRIITENYYLKLESRFLSIQFKTAKERYLHLMATHPILLQRAPLGYIASWLGITQETLSRIRAEV